MQMKNFAGAHEGLMELGNVIRLSTFYQEPTPPLRGYGTPWLGQKPRSLGCFLPGASPGVPYGVPSLKCVCILKRKYAHFPTREVGSERSGIGFPP